MDIFESATKNKYRYPSNVGELTTEDLWDLPLTSTKGASLDNTAKAINTNLRASAEESFVNASTPQNNRLSEQLDIVKSIIAARIADNQYALDARKRSSERGVIMSALARKETADLENMSTALSKGNYTYQHHQQWNVEKSNKNVSNISQVSDFGVIL